MVWRNVCEHFLPWCFGRQWGSPEWNCIQTRSCLYLQHLLLPWLLPLRHARIYVDQLSSAALEETIIDYLVRWESSPLPRIDPLPNSLLKTELVLLLVDTFQNHNCWPMITPMITKWTWDPVYRGYKSHVCWPSLDWEPLYTYPEYAKWIRKRLFSPQPSISKAHGMDQTKAFGITEPWSRKSTAMPHVPELKQRNCVPTTASLCELGSVPSRLHDTVTFRSFKVHGDVPDSSSLEKDHTWYPLSKPGRRNLPGIHDHNGSWEQGTPRPHKARLKGEGFQAVSRAKGLCRGNALSYFLPVSLVGWL